MSHLAPVIMAFIAVFAALQSPSSDGKPLDEAGIYPPIMALCAALMLLLNSFGEYGPRWLPKIRNPLAAVFGAVSAYLWIADDIGKHPLHHEVWFGLGLAWYMVVIFALIAALIIGLSTALNDD